MRKSQFIRTREAARRHSLQLLEDMRFALTNGGFSKVEAPAVIQAGVQLKSAVTMLLASGLEKRQGTPHREAMVINVRRSYAQLTKVAGR